MMQRTRRGVLITALLSCAAMAMPGCRGGKDDKTPVEVVPKRPAPSAVFAQNASALPQGALMIGYFDIGGVFTPTLDGLLNPGDFPEQKDNLTMMKSKIARIFGKSIGFDPSAADYMMYAVYGDAREEIAFVFGGVTLADLPDAAGIEVNGTRFLQLTDYESDSIAPIFGRNLPDNSGVVLFTTEALAKASADPAKSLATDENNRAVRAMKSAGAMPDATVFVALDLYNPNFNLQRKKMEREMGKIPLSLAVGGNKSRTRLVMRSMPGEAEALGQRISDAAEKFQAEVLEEFAGDGDLKTPATEELVEVYMRYLLLNYILYLEKPEVKGDHVSYTFPALTDPLMLTVLGFGGWLAPVSFTNNEQWWVYEEFRQASQSLMFGTVTAITKSGPDGSLTCELPPSTTPSATKVPAGGEYVDIKLDSSWDPYDTEAFEERETTRFVYQFERVDARTLLLKASADIVEGGEKTELEATLTLDEQCTYEFVFSPMPEEWK